MFSSRWALPVILSVALLAPGCRSGGEPTVAGAEQDPTDLPSIARALTQRVLIVDGHIDLPYRLLAEKEALGAIRSWDFATGTSTVGDFDYERARAGGLNAPFMSIYVPAEHQKTPGKSKAVADELISLVEEIVRGAPSRFAIARSPSELVAHQASGKVSLPLGIENASAFEDDLALVAHFHARGVRYATLTHSKDNQICDSSYDEAATWKGLSPFGLEVIRAMNRVGIMIDVSHVSDAAFLQAVALSEVPVIASHTSLRHFTPGFQRNASDALLVALGKKGGVLMVNFGSTFVKESSRAQGEKIWKRLKAYMAEQKIGFGDPRMKQHAAELKKQYPFERATVEDVADHIEHAIRVAGIDHVGLGSDFDGVGDTLPVGLEDVSKLPKLFEVLLARGHSEADLEKLASGNVLRVWREVETFAARRSALP